MKASNQARKSVKSYRKACAKRADEARDVVARLLGQESFGHLANANVVNFFKVFDSGKRTKQGKVIEYHKEYLPLPVPVVEDNSELDGCVFDEFPAGSKERIQAMADAVAANPESQLFIWTIEEMTDKMIESLSRAGRSYRNKLQEVME